MMLRASLESTAATSGTNTLEKSTLSDFSGLAKGSTAAGSPVRGVAALVDAAAIIGNFERRVRIADGTGSPLDTPVHAETESSRS